MDFYECKENTTLCQNGAQEKYVAFVHFNYLDIHASPEFLYHLLLFLRKWFVYFPRQLPVEYRFLFLGVFHDNIFLTIDDSFIRKEFMAQLHKFE